MFSDLIDLLIELKDKFLESRTVMIGIIHVVLVFVLCYNLYQLQIVNGDQYQQDYIEMTEKTVTTPAARGNIYDRNGNLLAYNEINNDVVIQDTGYYASAEERNLWVCRLVRILHANNEKISGELKIDLDDNGDYIFTTSSVSATKGFLRDVYGIKSIDELDDDEGRYPSDADAGDIIEREVKYFKLDETQKNNGIIFSKRELLDIINIRYTMSLTAYKKYEQTTVAKGISDTTKIAILEEEGDLIGVDVNETTRRVYNDAVYFSSIIGYTGKVQEDQLDTLKASDPQYTLNDTVGRIGIEQYMEYDLHGKKGEKKMYVDNVGRIKETISEIDPVAGNDVYLTIDRDMQVGIYNLLERQLAGILASKISPEDDPNDENMDASDLLIPVKDVYYQLINNNVLDIDHFSFPDADENEKAVYEKFLDYQDEALKKIRQELAGDSPTPLNRLDEDINQYMVFIYQKLVSDGIIVESAIDKDSEYYRGWKADTITMRDFLYSGVAENWLDSSVLEVHSQYSAADDIFMALVDFVENILVEDKDFAKLNYKYLIKKGIVTGKELCMALYSQGVLEDDASGSEYNRLAVYGNAYAYEFIVDKISKIEITPAQLALDPCTAGCVITNVQTGEVIALVSYPGYDNNRLTDNMDVEYYNSLLDDDSLPLYNNATQAKKAPGSTFKPLTAFAALEEGKITSTETVECTGVYKNVSPSIRCWIYPYSHGPLTVVGGIKNSCNFFFNEMGHRLATDGEGNYSTALGVDTIKEYASMFGLDHKSGVEINETEPSISSISPEQSAMGQGNHSFTNVQLARYISAIANRGTVYELSLIDKVTNNKGVLVKDYTPNVYSQIQAKDSTWDLVQQGMHEVITEGSAKNIFRDLEVDVAGKTGTAEESKTRANHAFFVSFAPYSDPEVAVTVNIPYGYSSSNAATVARNVYRFYYGYVGLDDILNGGALDVYDVKIGD